MTTDMLFPVAGFPGLELMGLQVLYRDGAGDLHRVVVGFAGQHTDYASGGYLLSVERAWTRDALARYVAGRVGRCRIRSTAPHWSGNWAWGKGGWYLGGWHDIDAVMFHAAALRRGWGPRRRIQVVELASLDPMDREVLVDGSGKHHAIALGRVAQHVGRSA